MDFFIRWLQRFVIGAVVIGVIWLIVTQVFEPLHERLPLFFTLILTYIISAYVLLPPIVQITLTIVRRGRIPRATRAGDGLPADPVNMLLVGSEQELLAAFSKAGWTEADQVSLRSSWKMIRAVIFNTSYPRAPFRSLYLFGRRQDHGFQEAIGNSPRARHHIRFWAANLDPDANPADFAYWSKKHVIDPAKPLIWVGAASKDLGIGFTQLTYQVTHRTDKHVDEEREYILTALRNAHAIEDEHYVDSGREVIGKYISDGRILTATLVPLPENVS